MMEMELTCFGKESVTAPFSLAT